MRCLIVEDDFVCRKVMQKMLQPYGECDIAVDGEEAATAFLAAFSEGRPYDLICLDIMMPKMDGQELLKRIRSVERSAGVKPALEVKVIMTTSLDSPREVVEAYYRGGCDGYLVKPIERQALVSLLAQYGFGI